MADTRRVRATPRLFGLVVVLGLIAAIAIGGCSGSAGSEDSDPDAPRMLPIMTTSSTPSTSIGVLSGEAALEFESIQDVVRLSDGRVVLADGGDQRLHFFGPTGEALGVAGGRGNGPFEFGSISSIYPMSGDTLMVLDGRTPGRVKWFSADGEFLRDTDVGDIWAAEEYSMDSWPVSRFLAQGASSAEVRARVDATLRGLPLPYGRSLIRYAQIAENDDIWLREEWSGNERPSRWLVLSPSGTPRHWVDLPAGFHPQTIRDGEVLGRAIGEFDVETAQAWSIERGEGTAAEPLWMTQPQSIPDSTAVDSEELMATVRSSIKFLASSQEMHYSRNYSYSSNVDSLNIESDEFPVDLEVEILFATSRGWGMIGALPNADRICTLAYGAGTPAGWMAGAVRCGNQP